MNIKNTLKKLLLVALIGMAASPLLADPTAVHAPLQSSQKWKFDNPENKTVMKLLGSVGRKAEDDTMKPIVKALETGVTVSQLRQGYDPSVDPAEFLASYQAVTSEVTDLLEFLSMAGALLEEAFQKSELLDLSQYKTHDPLLKTLIGLGQEEQQTKLKEASKDVRLVLEVLDQVLAIREALLFNAPLSLKKGLAVYYGRQTENAPKEDAALFALGKSEVERLGFEFPVRKQK